MELTIAEKIAVIKAVEEILGDLDFGLKVVSINKKHIEDNYLSDEDLGKKAFVLTDYTQANLGGIEQEVFFTLPVVIDRLEVYFEDFYYEALEERRGAIPVNISNGKEIEKGDYDCAVVSLQQSDNFYEMLTTITPEIYEDVVGSEIYDMTNTFLTYDNPVLYLADKCLMRKIFYSPEHPLDSCLMEYDNKIFVAIDDNEYFTRGEFITEIENNPKNFKVNTNYGEIFDEYFEDISSKRYKNFGLTFSECEYLGIDTGMKVKNDGNEEDVYCIVAKNIQWDVSDGSDDDTTPSDLGLPTKVEIPMEVITDAISDYLSDGYGYCHSGFTVEIEKI